MSHNTVTMANALLIEREEVSKNLQRCLDELRKMLHQRNSIAGARCIAIKFFAQTNEEFTVDDQEGLKLHLLEFLDLKVAKAELSVKEIMHAIRDGHRE